MAAKLKKRALAEYQSQVLTEDAANSDGSTGGSENSASVGKKLRLRHSTSKVRAAARRASTARSLSQHSEPVLPESSLFSLERISKPRDLSTLIIQLSPRIVQRVLDRRELQDVIVKLCDFATKAVSDDNVRSQIYLSLSTILKSYLGSGTSSSWSDVDSAELASLTRQLLKERCDEWVQQLFGEKSVQVSSAILSLLADWYGSGQRVGIAAQSQLLELTKKSLKCEGHQVKMNALHLLGTGLSAFTFNDRSAANDIVALVGRYTLSSDPRVRSAAFEALLEMNRRGQKLDLSMYRDFCSALNDDYDGVRKAAIQLIHVLANTYPDEQLRNRNDGGGEFYRLADDAFGKICNSVNDLSVTVREEAVLLIGNMTNISEEMLEQTLDKKLMSNMRIKKSAHERHANMVTSGEWSSGNKWADDKPREELDPDSVNVMSFGACGAFVHGLEDEFMAVRSQSIKSLTILSIKSPQLAVLALDYLVDMFNDEIELVRLEAIESLTSIANHITLQVQQLEIVLSALDDFSVVVREKLHLMLQASTIATKDGLESVISKLLENLKRYPQDKRSILATFKRLGLRHGELTLPLVSQLLEIHPFFDTAEPDIEDTAYLCILVLVFNAAHKCPTLGPLLDQYTKRHYHYLVDTYPHLIPQGDSTTAASTDVTQPASKTTTAFLHQVLERVQSTSHLKMETRIAVLERARIDLQRLGSIEPRLSDPSAFAEIYIHCQSLILKCLASQFWVHPRAMQAQQSEIVESNLVQLFKLSAQLEHRFIHLNQAQRRQIRLLKLTVMALHLVFIVKASNKSALNATDTFLREIERIKKALSQDEIDSSEFFSALLKKLSDVEERKPGVIVRLVQPILLTHPIQSLSFNIDVAMSHAIIYEPTGNNETPLKYTGGMVLAVPIDAELFNLTDDLAKMVRLAIKTPDQKVLLVTPMTSQFFKKDSNCRRLLTNAIMSHQVWSEALHVEISLVLDMSSACNNLKSQQQKQDKEKDSVIPLCDPVKVYVLPKAVKRGI